MLGEYPLAGRQAWNVIVNIENVGQEVKEYQLTHNRICNPDMFGQKQLTHKIHTVSDIEEREVNK